MGRCNVNHDPHCTMFPCLRVKQAFNHPHDFMWPGPSGHNLQQAYQAVYSNPPARLGDVRYHDRWEKKRDHKYWMKKESSQVWMKITEAESQSKQSWHKTIPLLSQWGASCLHTCAKCMRMFVLSVYVCVHACVHVCVCVCEREREREREREKREKEREREGERGNENLTEFHFLKRPITSKI